MCLALLSLFLISCTAPSGITSIDVSYNGVPEMMITGVFSINNLELTITRSNGETELIPVSENMLSSEDIQKFDHGGEHEITITYKGRKVKFSFVLFEDTLSLIFQSYFHTLSLLQVQNKSYHDWICELKSTYLPINDNVEFFYYENSLYWKYENNSFWTYVPSSELFNFEVLNDQVGVMKNEIFIPFFSRSFFINNLFEDIYETYIEDGDYSYDRYSFLSEWFQYDLENDKIAKIEFQLNEMNTVFSFGLIGSNLSSYPINNQLGLKHIGWTTIDESVYISNNESFKITNNIILFPSYQELENGLSWRITHESFFEKTIDIIVSGTVKLNGYALTLLYDSTSLSIDNIINPLSNIINDNLTGKIIFNYVNVQQAISIETVLISITFTKLTPYSTFEFLTAEEVIFVNDQFQVLYAPYSILNLYQESN